MSWRQTCQDKADELRVDLNWPYEGSQVLAATIKEECREIRGA